MEWPVELPAEQSFEVYARIATNSSENQVVIEAGGEKAVFSLPDTGGLENFKVAKLGEMKLPGGTAMLSVKGEKENWQECYLSNLQFRPAE